MAKRKPLTIVQNATVLELDGKKLTLVYDFAALETFREITGINLLDEWNPSKFTPKDVACFLYSGVYKHQPDIEPEWCFASLNLDNFATVFSTLLKALSKNMPDPQVAANPPKPVSENV